MAIVYTTALQHFMDCLTIIGVNKLFIISEQEIKYVFKKIFKFGQ